jgi:hypothetical protein
MIQSGPFHFPDFQIPRLSNSNPIHAQRPTSFSKLMKKILVAIVALVGATHFVSAQEQLLRREALKYAFMLGDDLRTLQGTPIVTDVDLKQPVAVRDGDYGALVLPEAKLSAETLVTTGDKIVPVGQLWLCRLTPIRNGEAVPAGELRVVNFELECTSSSAAQLTLGVKGGATGDLELLVFGKDKLPLLTLKLKKTASLAAAPISMTAARVNDEAGRITLSILGRYEASLMVTELGR